MLKNALRRIVTAHLSDLSDLNPISRSEFRRNVLFVFGIQGFNLAICLPVYLWADFHTRGDIALVSLLVFSFFSVFIQILSNKRLDFRKRLLDIYGPATPASRFFLNAWIYLPILGVPVIAYLLVAQKSSVARKVPFVFRHHILVFSLGAIFTFFGPIGMALVAVQFGKASVDPTVYGYWVTPPATNYIYSLFRDVDEAHRAKSEVHSSEGNHIVIPEKYSIHDATSAVLMEVVVTTKALLIKKREPAGEGSSAGFLALMDGTNQVMRGWDKRTPVLLRFSPINLLMPTNAVEGALISVVDVFVETKFRLCMAATIEEKYKSAEEKRPDLHDQLAKLKLEFEATNAFKESKTFPLRLVCDN